MIYVYFSIAAICWVAFAGAMFAWFQDRTFGDRFNKEWARSDLGAATLFGGFFALMWPIGWLIVLCMTGFLERGWSLKFRPRSST